ncbi:MAG TPA: enoyl-CoA hydratase-related protein [Longimicrobiaceae bacterium]|nr:enoyl-CoA hydratase-related protein [Longimicrobiaceae bacterium]
MSDYQNLRYDVQAGIATLTIDRPEKLNALDRRTIEELGAAVRRLGDEADVRGAIVTGSGPKAFVAGADIAELVAMGPIEGVEVSRLGQRVFREIELSRKPIVAAVNGFALGGGCELALACHLRVAAENARFGLPEVKLGIIPGYGGTLRLPRVVGKGRALEMILTGEPVDASGALGMGLVNRVVPHEQLLVESRALLARILANGPVAVALAIESVTRGLEMDLDDGLAHESDLFGLLAATDDVREGMRAFLERRAAEFKGR